MTATDRPGPRSGRRDLDFLLRRAEEEAIAEIRAVNVVVAERHGAMARAYRRQALDLLPPLASPPAAS